jgi:hypothetical protein
MQTTLRIDDLVFREAKSEAAREGISLTRLIENALRARLGRSTAGQACLPSYDSGVRLPAGFDLAAAVREADASYGQRLAMKVVPRRRRRTEPSP